MEEWIISSKKALNWFVEVLGNEEWERRRKNVVAYFNALDEKSQNERPEHRSDIDKLFEPLAVYDDWIVWYMYLIDSLATRPGCDEPFQSARIYPFFAAIGRHIPMLKQIDGIGQRFTEMLNERQNQPDSTLFELVVALAYAKSGWQVAFLEEAKTGHTPDLKVTRRGTQYFVECKRLAKVTEYAEQERQQWYKRWRHLAIAMQAYGTFAHADIIFKVPVEEVPEDTLGRLYSDYFRAGGLNQRDQVLETSQVVFSARRIDMDKVAKHMIVNSVRKGSPQMIELFAGEYEIHGSYTQIIAPSEISTYGLDDGLHVLNQFYGGVHQAWSAKWECIADESIDRKAKDIKKILSKAVNQIPADGKGIIHIGYETVSGPYVEFRRHEKIIETIKSFKFAPKEIVSVVCHAIQPLSKIEEWECAETAIFFGEEIDNILNDLLLLAPPGTGSRDSTHWAEDTA